MIFIHLKIAKPFMNIDIEVHLYLLVYSDIDKYQYLFYFALMTKSR